MTDCILHFTLNNEIIDQGSIKKRTMLIILVQATPLTPSKIKVLQAQLVSKVSNCLVKFITPQQVSNSIDYIDKASLYLTQDELIEEHLNKANKHVILWDNLSDLSLKLDVFLQLQRYIVQFPLKLKGWHIKEVLHNSDNCIIYLAVDKQGLQMAIKRFKFSPSILSDDMIKTLLHKIERYCGNHKGLVKFYDGGICDSAFYLVMEYLEFGTLRQTLDGCGNMLPQNHALAWFQEIVLALSAVHDMGLIHRHLKIENILMRSDGTLALADYGVSKRILLDAGYMHEIELFCSPHYVSPEQITGDAATKATDIYSLGVIFYELLVGQKPYSANEAHELMMHHIMAPVPVLPHGLSHFQLLLDKMMAKSPADRFSSVIDTLDHMPVAA